jgi:hypothetical protein
MPEFNMNTREIRKLLKNPDELSGKGFEVMQSIANLHNNDPESPELQELVLRALERREQLRNYERVLDALARERGLFPYLNPKELDTADRLAYEYHRPESLKDIGMVFHRPQARVYRELMAGKSVILSAPTSFGKSLIIDAVVASNKFKNILLVVPTIALIDETRRRLTSLRTNYKIITHSFQEISNRNLFVLTQERALEYQGLDNIDFLIIDEFYKLSPTREEDERCSLLNQVFYNYARRKIQFYLLGPSVTSISPEVIERLECTFIYERYPTVVSETHKVEPFDDEIIAL